MNEEKFADKAAYKTNGSLSECDLWRRIASHSFEDPEHPLTFTARLARDRGWSLAYARQAIEEYRRFCFLAVTGPCQATPSEEVDEVWHQHLTYSRDYWDGWCGKALERPLHHQPTKGGRDEGARFVEQYAETLARYEACFGPPDPAFWPGTADRFGGLRFQVVDLDRALVVPVPAPIGRMGRRLARLFWATAASLGLLATKAMAAGSRPMNRDSSDFLNLYGLLILAALATLVGYRMVAMRFFAPNETRTFELDAVELALIAGGRDRAADVLALQLVQAGELTIQADGLDIVERGSTGSPADILRRHGTKFTRSRAIELLEPLNRRAWDRLARDRLALSQNQVGLIQDLVFWLLAPLVAFGVLRLSYGFLRGKPVGFLLVLMLVMLFLGAVIRRIGKLGTWSGHDLVANYREDHARALRAPRTSEIVMAFAVQGFPALEGTALEGYGKLAPKRDGGSGCGSSGDGGDGGGGCGGGCGGG